MGNISTFGAFTTARLGIYAAQKGLDVTGHNIANINTLGYSRQRVDQIALRTGSAERYNSQYDTNVGSGVLCTGVSQLRDPYLDIRFRNESASVGSMDAKLSVLEDLSAILDEVCKGSDKGGVLEAQFNEMQKQLTTLMNSSSDNVSDSLVRSAADTLVGLLKDYAGKLEGVKEDQETYFKQDIKTVNSLLTRIRDLNDTIQKSEQHGDNALELRDERNNLLDELSGYTKISIETESVKVGAGESVDKLVVRTAGNPGYTLVNGSYAAQFSMPEKVPKLNPKGTGDADKYLKADGTVTGDPEEAEQVDNTNYDLDITGLKNAFNAAWSEFKSATHSNYQTEAEVDGALRALGPATVTTTFSNGLVQTTEYKKIQQQDNSWSILVNTTTTAPGASLGDNDLQGSLQAVREMLTEAGEFSSKGTVANVDPEATIKRGIPYYQHALDAMAQKFAQSFNEANTGYLRDSDGNYLGQDGKPLQFTNPDTNVLENITTKTDLTKGDAKTVLEGKGIALGGPLFSNSSQDDDPSGITADNISISKKWAVGDIRIVNSFVKGSGSELAPNSGATENILHMKSIFDGKQDYNSNDVVEDSVGGSYFKGSFQELLSNTSATLATDVKMTTTLLNTYVASATALNTSRDSVSGVDLNDEATSLMQYQKSYSAACRLMTTLDEALDKLINGTGVVGR